MKGYLVVSLIVLSALTLGGCRPWAASTAPAVKPVSNPAATPTPTPTPTLPVQLGLLDQVPNGYSDLVRWDVRGLLASQGAEALKKDFRSLAGQQPPNGYSPAYQQRYRAGRAPLL